ncbi:hypothetical protein [Synechococcus sp. BA-132 BA5]|uniref:hypothetical protein n=1 Tax=Synechococcus sp. BA-132 BA5 TaxID=3110252 RepID=UPI002B1F3D65|nr:hypothetical protein [Synechococcus sp. BA-132 BA5]MEA5414020.1 hypothetical protein [Synechococcus sp. BA-132 BA5]
MNFFAMDRVVQGIGNRGGLDVLIKLSGQNRCKQGGQADAHARADSKYSIGFGSGWRIAIASCAVMSCITACMPARID